MGTEVQHVAEVWSILTSKTRFGCPFPFGGSSWASAPSGDSKTQTESRKKLPRAVAAVAAIFFLFFVPRVRRPCVQHNPEPLHSRHQLCGFFFVEIQVKNESSRNCRGIGFFVCDAYLSRKRKLSPRKLRRADKSPPEYSDHYLWKGMRKPLRKLHAHHPKHGRRSLWSPEKCL